MDGEAADLNDWELLLASPTAAAAVAAAEPSAGGGEGGDDDAGAIKYDYFDLGSDVKYPERVSLVATRLPGGDEPGWRSATLVTAPPPISTETPRPRRRANSQTHSTMSVPAATSRTWEWSALGLSRVTMMGGLGLFLEPSGLPRGRLYSPLPFSSQASAMDVDLCFPVLVSAARHCRPPTAAFAVPWRCLTLGSHGSGGIRTHRRCLIRATALQIQPHVEPRFCLHPPLPLLLFSVGPPPLLQVASERTWPAGLLLPGHAM